IRDFHVTGVQTCALPIWNFGSCFDRLDDGCLGEPWTLFGEHCGWSAGGWVQTGYHTASLANFNSRPDEVQLHQAWLYAQKSIDKIGRASCRERVQKPDGA